tara:strand:+ start:73 stop:507 length:435 start_codon:yes stop_codon:yes gene_type:complete
MKKLLVVLLLLFSFSGYSQYSKKELKRLKKLDVKIINKGLDLTEDFVFLDETPTENTKRWESYMNNILFENNFEVGDYYYVKETNTNVINARYVITQNGKSISIKDLTTNKIAATIRWKKWIYSNDSDRYKFIYIFKKLIESNN